MVSSLSRVRDLFRAVVIGFLLWFQDRVMGELHSQGRTVEEITASLRRAPLPAHTIAAVKAAYALGLSEEDYVMPRKNHPVWELILANPRALRAEIHGWGDAEELEEVLLRLIGDSVSARGSDANRSISSDCKFQTSTPLSSHEALPKPRRVPN
ncbi:hypothetical protein GW17_00042778 [Ensete ventricosum]|nr:hypothetical protein GW17_00042778 [Ensete ventricosum]RZS06885.1 hypothetical protein BHM03_00037640 [Ensete ventricosum]